MHEFCFKKYVCIRRKFSFSFLLIYRFPAAGLRFSCKLLGLKTKVQGKENIVQNSGAVVLINHQSVLDLIGKTI